MWCSDHFFCTFKQFWNSWKFLHYDSLTLWKLCSYYCICRKKGFKIFFFFKPLIFSWMLFQHYFILTLTLDIVSFFILNYTKHKTCRGLMCQKVSGIITLNLYLTDPEVRLRLKFRLIALPKYMFIKSIFNSDEYLGKSKCISLVVTMFLASAADWEIIHYFLFSQ